MINKLGTIVIALFVILCLWTQAFAAAGPLKEFSQ